MLQLLVNFDTVRDVFSPSFAASGTRLLKRKGSKQPTTVETTVLHKQLVPSKLPEE